MKKRIHKLFFYTLIIGVYSVFFSVESFYNFEGQTTVRDIMGFTAPGNKQTPVATTAPLHSSYCHTFRLNKRYHQENIPPCPVSAPQPPAIVLTPLVLGSHRS